MRKILALFLMALSLGLSCKKDKPVTVYYGGIDPEQTVPDPDNPGGSVLPEPNADAVAYADLHDPIANKGQFFLPLNNIQPKGYWNVIFRDFNHREVPLPGGARSTGLQEYLLMQSVVGLINRACAKGQIQYAAWMPMNETGYTMELSGLGTKIGDQSAEELATKTYGPWEGIAVQPRSLIDGYVLTDLAGNPESGNVAAVAAHVYNSVIVDVRDEAFFKSQGLTMTYDARRKSVRDAFNEFKSKCRRNALVMMPVTDGSDQEIAAGELRDYAITNELFVINLVNPKTLSSNMSLLNDVLDWLEPNSQVIGWGEESIGEGAFVDAVSRRGHLMLAADWSFNMGVTSRNYTTRQPATLAKTINPRSINYAKKGHYVSNFLTDGDNYQFIITKNFFNNYYRLKSATAAKTAFELGTQSLIQLAPTRFQYLLEEQPGPECTVMETFGGGYYYIDTYSTAGKAASSRAANIKIVAERTAAHMRQHGIKVLHVMAMDILSDAAREMLQAFVDANDQLEGITAVQYNPYTGGDGKVIWLTNKAGYDIPCITTRFMLWKDQGKTPASVASTMNRLIPTTGESFSTVVIHAWSDFDGNVSSDAAQLLMNGLDSRYKMVSMQELIWRLRMSERPEQTLKYLATIK